MRRLVILNRDMELIAERINTYQGDIVVYLRVGHESGRDSPRRAETKSNVRFLGLPRFI